MITSILAPHFYGVYQLSGGYGSLMSIWSHKADAQKEIERLNRTRPDGIAFTVGKFRVYIRESWIPQLDKSSARFMLK